MKHKASRINTLLLCLGFASLSFGCGKSGDTLTQRVTNTTLLTPEQTGETLYSNEDVTIDASHTSDGYFMVDYTGESSKVKLQVTVPDTTIYTYNLSLNSFDTIPLTCGNGTYRIDVLENVFDEMYALAFTQDVTVHLEDEFAPFLYPNQYVWYTPDSDVYKFGIELSNRSSSDLDYVENVYLYVIKNIEYDTARLDNLPLDYIPDVDQTLDTKKGLCFDYASLMTALLRSQGIPTKLIVGYSGQLCHSWISVYLDEIGWVDNIIEFDGTSWSLMDPTLGAGNDRNAVKDYINEDGNYIVKYFY